MVDNNTLAQYNQKIEACLIINNNVKIFCLVTTL